MGHSHSRQRARCLPVVLAALALVLALGACRPGATPPPAAPTSQGGAMAVMVMPDDGRAPLVNALRAARQSIRLTVYLLIDNDIVDELIQAHRRGVTVRVLVEPTPYGGGAASRDDVAKLRAAGIQVRDGNPTFRYTHQKTLIIDETVALIMTLNLTPSSFTRNREHGVIDTDTARVAEIARVFEADWTRREVTVSHPDLVWSPDNARDRLLAFLRAARATLDMEAEVVSDDQVVRTLADLAARGVAVRLMLPPLEPDDLSAGDIDWLAGRGVQVRRLASPYPHTKLAIVDGTRAYVGSVNFTTNSFNNNRELGMLISDPAALQRLRDSFEADWPRGQ